MVRCTITVHKLLIQIDAKGWKYISGAAVLQTFALSLIKLLFDGFRTIFSEKKDKHWVSSCKDSELNKNRKVIEENRFIINICNDSPVDLPANFGRIGGHC